MATFVLISGAWHAGWCWEYVAPLLTARGHRAIAPDLPGTGADDTEPQDVTRAGWARFVGDLIISQPEPVILVGHSRGGLTIGDAAGPVADRIACMVSLSAMVTAPNVPFERVAAMMMEHDGEKMRIEPAVGGTAFHLAKAQIGTLFYNCTPSDRVTRAAGALRAEPVGGSFGEAMPSRAILAIPKVYIECLRDLAVPITVQRRLQALTRFDEVMRIDTDHSPFYSAPEELADCLDRVASNYFPRAPQPNMEGSHEEAARPYNPRRHDRRRDR